MSEGRFSNLEIDEHETPGGRGSLRAADARGEGPKHFIEQVRDADYYIQQAESLALGGDHAKALRAYAAALGENPLLVDAWVGQVHMLLELEEYPEAVLWADKAIERFPDNPQLLAVKSVALYRMGHRRRARGLSDVALGQKGESEIVWLSRGELMLGEDRAASEECFQHARRLSRRKGVTMLSIGGLYLRYGRYSQALGALREASRELPHSAWVWYQLGRVQAKLGDQHARVSFEEARRLNAHNETFDEALREPPPGIQTWLRNFLGGIFRR